MADQVERNWGVWDQNPFAWLKIPIGWWDQDLDDLDVLRKWDGSTRTRNWILLHPIFLYFLRVSTDHRILDHPQTSGERCVLLLCSGRGHWKGMGRGPRGLLEFDTFAATFRLDE